MKLLLATLLLCFLYSEAELLKLVMMVKNEAQTIQATLESAAPYIDSWLILDTGSTDNTRDIVQDFFKKSQLPGALVERPFVDFSTSRNYALEQADEAIPQSDWLLLLDGDDFIRDAATLRNDLAAIGNGCALVRWRWQNDYRVIKLIRARRKYRFTGRVHEALPNVDCVTLPGAFYVDHIVTESSRKHSSKRWERDVDLLLQDLKDFPPKHSQHIRSTFYLAKTYDWLGQKEDAFKYYKKRTELGGWEEEIFQSFLHMGHFTTELPLKHKYLRQAADVCPDRAEPWYWMAMDFDVKEDWERCFQSIYKASKIPLPNRSLDVSTRMYSYNIPLMVSKCGFYSGHYVEGLEATQAALLTNPNDTKLEFNRRFYLNHPPVKKTICLYVGYSAEPWSPQTYKNKSLGGSETAAMWLAHSLAQRGYNVTVAGGVASGIYDGVHYVSLGECEAFFTTVTFDIIIVSRYVHFFLQHAPNATQRYIWGHDVSLLPWWNGNTLPIIPYLKNLWPTITSLVTITDWQRRLYQSTYPFVTNKTITVIGNGLNPVFFDEAGAIKRDPYRMIWSSNPNRGLERMLRLVPALKAKMPQLTVHIFAHEAGEFNTEQQALVDSLNGTVVWRGPVPQRELAKEILASSFWVYPTHFRETYCITAIEMMAGGVMPFIVPYAGLHDVVKGHGVVLKVPGFTGDKANVKDADSDWRALVKGMDHPDFITNTVKSIMYHMNSLDLESKRRDLMSAARSLSWAKRAEEWEALFNIT